MHGFVVLFTVLAVLAGLSASPSRAGDDAPAQNELVEMFSYACEELDVTVAEYCLRLGVDPDQVPEEGGRPLIRVLGELADSRSLERRERGLAMVRLLASHGASPGRVGSEEFGPAEMILALGDFEAWEVLRGFHPQKDLLALAGWEEGETHVLRAGDGMLRVPVPKMPEKVEATPGVNMLALAGRPADAGHLLFTGVDPETGSRRYAAVIAHPRLIDIDDRTRLLPRFIHNRTFRWEFADALFNAGFPEVPALKRAGTDELGEQTLILCRGEVDGFGEVLLATLEVEDAEYVTPERFLQAQMRMACWLLAVRMANGE